jgi:hypothetical protein
MQAFLSEVEGNSIVIPTVNSKRDGLFISVIQDNSENKGYTRVEYNPNVVEEDFFQSDWPIFASRIDKRDVMHRRGWTYFKIQGHIRGMIVTGSGRIPFIYKTCKQYRPWLKLRVGDTVIMDKITIAVVQNERLQHTTTYKAGSFFAGLSRPWMGLHSLDTVRRDAAEQRIPFSTELRPDGKHAQVDMTMDTIRLVYTIDLENDLVDRIDFMSNGREAGRLVFHYINELDQMDRTFVEPRINRVNARNSKNHPGLRWLVQLMEDSLVQ